MSTRSRGDGDGARPRGVSRREMLASIAGVAGATVFTRRDALFAQSGGATTPAAQGRGPGSPTSELGRRSPHEQLRRVRENLLLSYTPHSRLDGIITPADLHFERHHAGVPSIDPQGYKLLIHGMVERPRVFDLAALWRYPKVSRICFIECSGNGFKTYRDIRPDLSPEHVDGLMATSEWVGVPLATLFREVGVKPGATWFLAESMDGALMSRSIPVAKAWDDAMIAYVQNGEPIRPEQGYPARLLLPGWEGSPQVKWIRRIELADRPFMTREETARYSDPLPDCSARLFSFEIDAKSLITFPAYPAQLPDRGWWEIQGLAWSGRGRITRVEVSGDGGRNWHDARLEQPVLPKCHTRFRTLWQWQGTDALLMSRATDETGYVQPTLAELRQARGLGTQYHWNHIRAWRVRPDGRVLFGLEG